MNTRMDDILGGLGRNPGHPWRTAALAAAASVGADVVIRSTAEPLLTINPDTLPLKWRAVIITALLGSFTTSAVHALSGRVSRNPARLSAVIVGMLLGLSFIPIFSMHRDTGARAIAVIMLLRVAPPAISLALLKQPSED